MSRQMRSCMQEMLRTDSNRAADAAVLYPGVVHETQAARPDPRRRGDAGRLRHRVPVPQWQWRLLLRPAHRPIQRLRVRRLRLRLSGRLGRQPMAIRGTTATRTDITITTTATTIPTRTFRRSRRPSHRRRRTWACAHRRAPCCPGRRPVPRAWSGTNRCRPRPCPRRCRPGRHRHPSWRRARIPAVIPRRRASRTVPGSSRPSAPVKTATTVADPTVDRACVGWRAVASYPQRLTDCVVFRPDPRRLHADARRGFPDPPCSAPRQASAPSNSRPAPLPIRHPAPPTPRFARRPG
jgi:hypothetical protein